MSDLAALLDAAWDALLRGVADRDADLRLLTLATAGTDGWPQARTVVLRGADRAAGRLTVHTDRQSAKVAELAADPRATLLGWDAGAALQVRLRVRVAARDGTAEEWARVPPASRPAYSGDPARFTVLTATVEAMDLLHLGPVHRRAVFLRADGWAGVWRAP